MAFRGGILCFYRAKELTGRTFSVNRVYREISSSLLVYQDKTPGLSIGKVFCFAAKKHGDDFRSLLADAANQEPVVLDVERVVTLAPSCVADPDNLFSMTAAIGAAVRNL
jgi:type IV pilus assembly protein PilM